MTNQMSDSTNPKTPWKISQFNPAVYRFVVYRDTDKGIELLCGKSGFPRTFCTYSRAKNAIAKATGAQQ
jgi:hypothetical protein